MVCEIRISAPQIIVQGDLIYDLYDLFQLQKNGKECKSCFSVFVCMNLKVKDF